MNDIAKNFKIYIETHPFDPGDNACETVLDQLYHAYTESRESDPVEISSGFKELEDFLYVLPLVDNNAVFNLCCRLCSAYEYKAFLDGLQCGTSNIRTARRIAQRNEPQLLNETVAHFHVIQRANNPMCYRLTAFSILASMAYTDPE